MKLHVDIKKLRDAPFNEDNIQPFIFDMDVINPLIDDLRFGNPSCYLVSGYRGAGKSSFIKKVEQDISSHKNIVFVHSSFAKYKSHTYLLRKLIRGLYQSLNTKENSETLKNLKEKEFKLDKKGEETSELLGSLYEKTFHDIIDSKNNLAKNEKEIKSELDIIWFIGYSLALLLSLSNLIYPWLGNDSTLFSIFAVIGSGIGVIKEIGKFTLTSTNQVSSTEEFQRKSLYDDEISDYHFYNLIHGLVNKDFQVVFVLDELDKVKEQEVNDLINEMKPYLVSGLASFIVVAGQELFYKYQSSVTEDDAILSTLFSRIIHVRLLSVPELTSLFNQLLLGDYKNYVTDPEIYRQYIEDLIFRSKRIPRRFINLIRQNIIWENGNPYLYINDSNEYKLRAEMVNAIQKIDDEEISVNFSEGTRDYLTMQLYLKAEKIIALGLKKSVFNKSDLT